MFYAGLKGFLVTISGSSSERAAVVEMYNLLNEYLDIFVPKKVDPVAENTKPNLEDSL